MNVSIQLRMRVCMCKCVYLYCVSIVYICVWTCDDDIYTQLASSYSMKRTVPRGHSLLSDHFQQLSWALRVLASSCVYVCWPTNMLMTEIIPVRQRNAFLNVEINQCNF